MSTTGIIRRVGDTPLERRGLPPTRTPLKPGEMERFGAPKSTAVEKGQLGKLDHKIHTALEQGDESRHVRNSGGKSTGRSGESEHSALTKQAERWVSQTFFGTLLRQMRQSPFKSELFSGGRGGEVFAEMHDQRLAEHMAHASGRKLSRSIVDHIERSRRGPKKQSANPLGNLDTERPESIPTSAISPR